MFSGSLYISLEDIGCSVQAKHDFMTLMIFQVYSSCMTKIVQTPNSWAQRTEQSQGNSKEKLRANLHPCSSTDLSHQCSLGSNSSATAAHLTWDEQVLDLHIDKHTYKNTTNQWVTASQQLIALTPDCAVPGEQNATVCPSIFSLCDAAL